MSVTHSAHSSHMNWQGHSPFFLSAIFSNTTALLLQYAGAVVVFLDPYELCHACDPVISALFRCTEQGDAKNGIQFMKLLCDNNPVINI